MARGALVRREKRAAMRSAVRTRVDRVLRRPDGSVRTHPILDVALAASDTAVRSGEVLRAVGGVRGGAAGMYDRAVAASARRRPRELRVIAAAVSVSNEVSLRLAGDADVRASMRGVMLRSTDDPRRLLECRTSTSHTGALVRAVAVLPDEAFLTSGAAWRLVASSDDAEIELSVADRRYLSHRWTRRSFDELGWPPRLTIDRRGRPVVSACGNRPGVAHTLRLDVDSATVTWAAGPNDPPELRMIQEEGTDTLAFAADEIAHGYRAATINLPKIYERDNGAWLAFVLDANHELVPLRHAPGEYPPLSEADTELEVAAGPDKMLVCYTAENQLAVRSQRRSTD